MLAQDHKESRFIRSESLSQSQFQNWFVFFILISAFLKFWIQLKLSLAITGFQGPIESSFFALTDSPTNFLKISILDLMQLPNEFLLKNKDEVGIGSAN